MLLGKTEVRNHRPALAQQNVRQFQVAMQVLTLRHLDETGNDVLHQLQHFQFIHFPLFLQETAEIALVAVLCNDVTKGRLADHVHAPQNVGMF
jgi:hypothetical protein